MSAAGLSRSSVKVDTDDLAFLTVPSGRFGPTTEPKKETPFLLEVAVLSPASDTKDFCVPVLHVKSTTSARGNASPERRNVSQSGGLERNGFRHTEKDADKLIPPDQRASSHGS